MNTLDTKWQKSEYNMPVIWNCLTDEEKTANIRMTCVNCKNTFYGYMSGMMDLFSVVVAGCNQCREFQL
jgi:hypothetical protein